MFQFEVSTVSGVMHRSHIRVGQLPSRPRIDPGAGSLLVLWLCLHPAAGAAVPEVVRFNQHVRPILSNSCLYCHGPDARHREADLRLDTYAGATEDAAGAAAIVPGQPDESVLLERITAAAHVPLPGPRLPADRRAWARREADSGLSSLRAGG